MKKCRDYQQEKSLYQGGWILLLTVSVLIALSRVFDTKPGIPPCMLHKWTGYYCPGCGGTRACIELLRGHFFRSFLYHPAVLYGGVLYFWFMVSHTIEYVSKGRISIGMRYTDKYLAAGAVLIIVQCMIKNLVKAVWGIGLQ